ncbi:foldase protein PrsA [Paenibacillus sp. Leaf72]|uniref:foldase protein PrsA n=1 Tax=Paenibacillus sp. Leaf72 TaxID=1736234 RepID=UPI0006F7F67C|nr:peptidylprolyl isomerase [Paenibacillus sp. Leaf72]KQO18506.1 peptidylprolyl isomerase [Paenibacillus sp. Leaf72]
MDNQESQRKEEELKNAAEQETNTHEDNQHTTESTIASPNAAGGAPLGGSTPPPPRKSGNGAWIALSAVLAILLVIVAIKPVFGGGNNAAVATVNKVDITKEDLYEEMLKSGGKTTLDNLITQQLITQEAKASNVTVTEADIDEEINTLKASFGTDEQFNAALAQYGVTLESLRKDAETQVKIRKLLEPSITITDDQIKEAYEQNKASYGTGEEIKASHILVATQEEADAILKQLKDGADFATLAKEKSTDTGTKDNGGDLGFFGKGVMDPAFEEAAFALEVDQISDVVKSSFGFHIIKKTGFKAATSPTFEEKKEEIRKQLLNQQIQEKSATWIQEIRDKATITNTLEEKTEEETDASANPDAAVSPEASAAQ